EVRAQRDDWLTRADLAHESGASREALRREAGCAESFFQQRRRCMLVVSKLRMRVQVPAYRDQFFFIRAEPVVEPRHTAHLGAPACISSSNKSTTVVRSPLFLAAVRRCRS